MQLAIGIVCLALLVLLVRAARPSASGPLRAFTAATGAGATFVSLAGTILLAFGIAFTVAGVISIGG